MVTNMAETLEDFLREKKRKDDQQAINWEERKAWWLSKINDLYNEVKEWLEPLVSEGTVNIIEDTVGIYEELLGTYSATSLDIKVGFEVVKLRPIGTIIIAALGRVDFIGEEGTIKILLEQKGQRPQIRIYVSEQEGTKSDRKSKLPPYDQIETEWIVPIEKGRLKKYQALNKEVFYDSLKRVMIK
jgi:hypothetical protein